MNDGDAPLRVAVLADSLGDGGGIDRYASELLRGLDARADVELTVVARPEAAALAHRIAPSAATIVPIRGRGQIGRAWWERERLGRLLERSSVQIVHGTKHVIPRTSLPTVLTAHDVTVLTSPEQFPFAKRMLVPRVFRASLRRADVVIAVSETTRRRLVAADLTLEPSIMVVPNGMSSALASVKPRPLQALAERPFALVVGDLSPRKNVDVLLGIWEEVHRETGWMLAVVGPEGWKSAATQAGVADLVAQGLAVRPGRIDDSELRWCYEHTEVLLYPSFEEGFGLPVVEALALGAPVVAGTDDALVEVGAGRVRHVDPHDPDAWRAAILEVALGPTSGDRAQVTRNWSDTVAGTVAAYQRALRRGGRRHS